MRKRRRSAARGSAAGTRDAAKPDTDGADAAPATETTAASDGGAAQPEPVSERPYGRAEAKNAAARDALVPLREGERPRAVTVGAILAVVSAVINAASAFGIGIEGPEQSPIGPLLLSVLMVVIAWGMWHVRYWAVLGMQALLAITLVVVALYVVAYASAVQAAALVALVILPLGALFWFLVKAMARIQMPERG